MTLLGKRTIRLIKYTLVIGGSFYFGILIYQYTSFSFLRKKEVTVVTAKEFAPILEKAVQTDFTIQDRNLKFVVKSADVKKWIEPYIRSYTGKKDMRVAYPVIIEYLNSITPSINIEPVNAKLKFKNNRAEIFVPSSGGRRLNSAATANIISKALFENKPSASLAFDIIEPEITLEKVNDLGIKTLLGKGESDYGKSSPARIHNIKIGMSKFNGVILEPGEEFSFNNLLGEVDENEGYQAELVIKNGELVREYGGGLCQVATTVFRSAILSGLEIKERKPHSFPVQYYNPQGFDATIYPGIVDLKFVNNTAGHVLIQTRLAGNRLIVEIYGSNDDIEVAMDGPFQYDQRPSGAMKAYFVRKIYKDGNLEKEERFDSVYKAPPPHPEERNPLE